MKYKVLFLLTAAITMFYTAMVLAEVGNRIDALVNNVPKAFTVNDDGSEVLLCGSGKFAIHDSASSSADIAWGVGTATAAPAGDSGTIPNGTSYNGVLVAPNQTLYIRSVESWVIAGGDVHVVCQGVK